jgi:metal-responsive CopG/Arc/MetJ family transcriptional regulator
MAKKTVSFSLEEDIIEAIDKYQEEKRLSSRSSALERMILSLMNFNDVIKSMSLNNSQEIRKLESKEECSDILDNSIEDIRSNIPD